MSEPEIILPRQSVRRSKSGIDDDQLELVASMLDDAFAIPGTNWRFGLDAIIGLVPGIGDLITSTFSFLIVFSAWQRGLPRVTIARMIGNIAIDTLVGAMPLVGDFFDAAWKSNRKNVDLLKRATVDSPRQQQAKDWAALLFLLIAAGAMVAVPIWMLVWLLRHAF
jgi:formate/nitrite transporter FocA (FNT family)